MSLDTAWVTARSASHVLELKLDSGSGNLIKLDKTFIVLSFTTSDRRIEGTVDYCWIGPFVYQANRILQSIPSNMVWS